MKTIKDFVQFAPIWLVLVVFRVVPLKARSNMIGWITANVAGRLPNIRKRVDGNLRLAFPEMDKPERAKIHRAMAANVGRTLSEILYNREFRHHTHRCDISGPGLDVLKSCKQAGKGAIIVSGHFGQWEAIRHVLAAQGMETGAVYRPTNNQFYEPYFLSGIKLGGEPIVPRGTVGLRKMIKNLRNGGFMAVLIDQRQNDGVKIPFMGNDALTSTASAELALKLDIPLVPVAATRMPDGRFDIVFSEPIEPSDAMTMTKEVNAWLETLVRAHPDQWFWVHKRWVVYS